MKYAVMMPADQTMVFAGPKWNYFTHMPREALLWDTFEEAVEVYERHWPSGEENRYSGWISVIDDEERFRAAHKTWCYPGDPEDGSSCFVCDDFDEESDEPYWGKFMFRDETGAWTDKDGNP